MFPDLRVEIWVSPKLRDDLLEDILIPVNSAKLIVDSGEFLFAILRSSSHQNARQQQRYYLFIILHFLL